jgi:hypothetical protein
MQAGRDTNQSDASLEQVLGRLGNIERLLAHLVNALADQDDDMATDLEGQPLPRQRQGLDTL